MNFTSISKFNNLEQWEPIELLPSCCVDKIAPIGTVLFDELSNFRKVRDYSRLRSTFPSINLWKIPDPILSDEFAIHRGSRLYVDSSIFSADPTRAHEQEIVDSLSSKIQACGDAIDETYQHESALVLHNEGGGTWGHFLIQNFPKVLLYLKNFPDGKIVVPREQASGGESNFARIFEVFGISSKHLLPVDRLTNYRFRELVLIDFMYNMAEQIPHPYALDLLSSGVVEPIEDVSTDAKLLFADRLVQWQSRKIENQKDLDQILDRHGVKKIPLGEMHPKKQFSYWKNSNLIVSTLGSDLANIAFGREGGRILALSPDWFGDNFFYNLAVMKGMQWNELRCGELVEQHETRHRSSFNVNADMVDIMLTSLCRG